MPNDEIPESELAVARAIARRLGRTVFGVVEPPGGGRRLATERPDDPATLAFSVERGGAVRLGPAGRRSAGAPSALVHDASTIPAVELEAMRDHALLTGRTIFVAEDLEDPDAWALYDEAPGDGTLRYAVRPTGEVIVGAAATAEPAAAARDTGWTARVGAALRALRRLRERADELIPLSHVTPRDWSRVERLVPDGERRALHPAALVGLPGPVVADAVRRAAEREVERLRRGWRPA
ncbi:hypothetical protein J421_1467 [Gemmatirosa kalamazoonensis]|uniref:Uncharacterized protein n=1 Tax=Gemmatirosa kalamazoonensis TaxID=861299 RepID=W0RD00_9BACT|nr:hypothetical protein [Gemmatirosa kalamazoonensis]AHG89004.1 hypothetical protein J421_1467 [Gemmatirosa kalamazoonensis]